MRTIHCLQIDLRIPVRIIDDDGVGRRQIDAEAAGAGRQQKDKLAAVRPIEILNSRLAIVARRLPIQSQIGK
jgi:hypothetical protein